MNVHPLIAHALADALVAERRARLASQAPAASDRVRERPRRRAVVSALRLRLLPVPRRSPATGGC